jgi:hypothetical protein
MSNFAACWQLATPLSSSGVGCAQLIYLDRVTRPQARVAIATVLKMESWCDERGATERGCARTVDASSIRMRCDGSRQRLRIRAQRAELLDEAGVFDPEIVSEQRTDR